MRIGVATSLAVAGIVLVTPALAAEPMPPGGCTSTCVAVMVVPLVVPSTRTVSPVLRALAEVDVVAF